MKHLFAVILMAMLLWSCDTEKDNASPLPSAPIVAPEGVEAVDLGLSVKWASCNIGASSPESYGDYFAWGEVASKESYTFGNSKTYGKSFADISGNKEYDAAAQIWEHGWRLPTAEECQELLDNCTWRWTAQKGVNGMLVTAANGNSIFLPAAGYRDGASTITKGSYGSYWSSQPAPDSDNFAGYIFFSEKNHGYDKSVRSMGLVIRPVI